MKNKLTLNWGYFHGLRLLIVLILALGIFFRFVNLDRKVYWQDETATSLRIAGHTKEEFVKQVFNGQVISVEELRQRYLYLNSQTSWFDTVKALTGRPEHSPLYYLMARFWAQCFGTSVAVMRSLPALISLLIFPSIYWLCLELFESSLVGWVAVALIAVSPVHVLYAQEARQYSLWAVSILLSSASLLRATRLKTNRSWGIYAATMALGLYSHLFFGLIALGHGIYILFTNPMRERLRHRGYGLSRNAIAYLLASLAGLLTFLPWLWVAITYFMYSSNQNRVMAPVSRETPLQSLIGEWFRNINRVFHNADLGSANIILVILVVYSIYFVCRHTPKRVWLFILTLIGVTALTLGLPDLILGGRRSVRTRYLMPCYLGIQLTIAYLLATQMTTPSKIWRQKLWQIVTILLISVGVVSGAISSQAQTSWSKNRSITKHYPKIAQIINQAEEPLVISDGSRSPTNILSLSYLLEPNVKLQLLKQANIPNVQREFREVFLFDASELLLKKLQQEKNYRIDSVVDKKRVKLWKIEQSRS